MAEVRLVDLEVIKRFSLAVRQDTASADEVLAALDASRAVVLAALGRPEPPVAPNPGPKAARAKTPQPASAGRPAKRPTKPPVRKAGAPAVKKTDEPSGQPASAPLPSGKAVSARRRAGRAGRE